MLIFLTGGTGFIGKAVAKALLAEGWDVVALVRHPDSPQAQALKEMGAACVAGDVLDRESMRASMTDADAVVHNAGRYEYGADRSGRQQMRAINVTGTENVLGLAFELGIPRTVYVSTTEYFGGTGLDACDETHVRQSPCHSYYEQTKVEAHEIARRYQQRGLPLLIVCPNGVIGPNDHSPYGYFLRMYLNRVMPPFAWAPDILLSFVHVDDLAKGIALAIRKGRPGQTYILAGEPMRRRDFAAIWNTKPGGLKIRYYMPN